MKFFYHLHYWLLLFWLPSLLFAVSEAQTPTTYKWTAPENRTVSGLLVIGDSTVDQGNNDYIPTLFRSDFPPYGKDFKGHLPTGRFSNGRLPPDFLVSYVGFKDYLPAYLDPSLSIEDLITGVSFASAGSGYDPLTGTALNVISIATQVEYLKEYKARIESWMGKEKMENHMKKAVVLVSCGTNDFVNTYFSETTRRNTFTVSAYENFILDKVKELTQNLWSEGVRKVAITGLPPMGCLPVVITLNSKDVSRGRNCIESYNSVARNYNFNLQKALKSLESAYIGLQIIYVDIYTPLIDMIQGRGKSSFDHVDIGCCGTGYLEAGFLCNAKSFVCSNASKYVFFDSIHPTEKAYYNIIEANRLLIDKILGK